jgi:hypothetical protein
MVKLKVGMTPTLARKIALLECLQTQIVCFLFRQLDNRLKAREHAFKRGKNATYVYA